MTNSLQSLQKNALEDLDRVAAEALQCTACGLSERRTNVVFSDGNPASPLMLIGEGPGLNEDQQGVPFVGRAGKLLDQALMDNGLDRRDVYICNVVKCRACDWNGKRASNRAPTTAEMNACRPWLDKQISLIKPKVILCIGAPSAKSIISPDFAITKQRGTFYDCEYADVAIATLHPAYVLRQMGARTDGGYSLVVDDVESAWRRAND